MMVNEGLAQSHKDRRLVYFLICHRRSAIGPIPQAVINTVRWIFRMHVCGMHEHLPGQAFHLLALSSVMLLYCTAGESEW